MNETMNRSGLAAIEESCGRRTGTGVRSRASVRGVRARARRAVAARLSGSGRGRFTPTVSDFRYDFVLGNISVAYEQAELVGDKIAPVVDVGARHAKYRFWNLEAFRVFETLRTPRSRANEISHSFDEREMRTEEQALIESVAKEEKEEAEQVQGGAFNLEQEAVETATASLNLGREKRIAASLRAPGALGGEVTLGAGAKFDNDSSSPLDYFRQGIASVRAHVGQVANFAEIPYDVFQALKHHPELIAQLSANQTKVLTLQSLQEILEIPEIIVSSVVENVAPVGQDAELLDLWGRDIIIGFRNPNPGRRRMTLAQTFRYKGSPEQRVRRWYEEDRKTEFFEVSYEEDTQICAPGAGYIIREAIAA